MTPETGAVDLTHHPNADRSVMSADDFRCQAQLHLFPFGNPPLPASLLLTTASIRADVSKCGAKKVPGC